jgi:hypothetical protein
MREVCGLICGQPSEEDVHNVRHSIELPLGKVPTAWKVREYKYEEEREW